MGAMGAMGAMVSGVCGVICFTGATVATGADATGVSMTASVTKWDRARACPGPGAAGAVANAQGSEVNGRPFGPVGPLGPGTGSEGNDDIGAMDGADTDEMLIGVIGVDWTGTALPRQKVLASYILSPISSPAILKQVKGGRWLVWWTFTNDSSTNPLNFERLTPQGNSRQLMLIHAYIYYIAIQIQSYIRTCHLSLLLRGYPMQPQEKQICSTKVQNVPHPKTTTVLQAQASHAARARHSEAHGCKSQTCTSPTS